MPELPEVETMVHRLQKWNGWTIEDAKITIPTGSNAEPRFLPDKEYHEILGQPINGIYRRGKHIVFLLSNGALLAHNAMSGYWDSADEPWTFDYVEGQRVASDSDVRVTFKLNPPTSYQINGDYRFLRFHDARMFGSIHFLNPEQLAQKLSTIGPEALETDHLYEPSAVMTEGRFVDEMKKSKQPIKVTIMDQRRIAGVGNIYASEACWVASIDPRRAANSLSEFELAKIFVSIVYVLQEALDRDLAYDDLFVYGKTECKTCKEPLLVEDLKGRSTYRCPTCQT
jgi:formamidopyrimidine-DNA glycosylase